ncbi:murein biosynthesis integral membrane protein MurJ [Streptosporangium sp. NPDC002721]|uniref:murein biosynthesis integral membrane protein MurJ n=1 Tax=Streptosporangium sp. NPDC002721 TaxID=3366188 RepID=UPI00368ACEDD
MANDSRTEVDRDSRLIRSSAVMVAGTFVSRVTGFVRTVVLVAALGTLALGDTFNTANTIPNIVFETLLGGVLTAAHVPLLVRARQRSKQYGEQFEQRLFTLLLLVLAVLTAVAMALAPLLIRLYGSGFTAAQNRLAVVFLLFFLPQIFFYGFSAVASASLNTQGRFAAPMWAPVLNNVVVSAVGVAFLLVADGRVTPENITDEQVILIALGTTAGVAAQAVALLPALHRMGFRWRPRFDFRRDELGEMGSMAGWTLAFVVVQQIGLVFYTNIANTAGVRGMEENVGYGVGLTPWTNAYQFFQLPFAIVAVSVITALMPRMSGHAAEGRLDRVSADLAGGLRLSLVVIIPAAALLFGLSAEICVVLFAHGATTAADALMIANVLRVFAIMLVPFTVFQLLQRGFYALADTRTPALVGMATMPVGVAGALLGSRLLPTRDIVLGIAFSQGLAWVAGCVFTVLLLRRRLGSLQGRVVGGLVLKVCGAALIPLGIALVAHTVVGRVYDQAPVPSFVALAGGGVVAVFAFAFAARRLGVQEIEAVTGMVTGRLQRGRRT